MERPRTNASEHLLNIKKHENERVINSGSRKKRKVNDESVNCENKKKCLAGSSSTTINTTNHLKQNWKCKQKTCLKGFENSCEICHYKYENSCPNRLISFMYQLELSVLCLHRKYSFKKSSESVIFRNSVNGQFNNIVLCFEGDNFCIKVQHVDTFYSPKSLNFNSFFSSICGNFTLSNYLNEFAAELICYSDCVTDAPKYLIIYTNSALDLTKSRKFLHHNQPQFCSVNEKTQKDLFNLFKSNGEFYHFSDTNETRDYLYNAVKFTEDIVEQIQNNGFSVEEVRVAFFDRLIFAVNQPTIEELIDTVRKEVRNRNDDFLKLRNEVMRQLTTEEDCEKVKKEFLQSTLYSFNLLMIFIHNLYLDKNVSSIKYEERNVTQNIRIDNAFVLKALEFDISKLSPKEFIKQREIFSINSHFLAFLQEMDRDPRYFLVYTNVSLSLLEELILGNGLTTKSEDAKYRPKFTRISGEEERFKGLRHSFVKTNYLFQFSQGETRRKLLDLLKLPQCFELKKLDEAELKNLFLDKIVFAVNQKTSEQLYNQLECEIAEAKVPYDCEDLHKIGLRSLKSHESTPMTRELLGTLLSDLKNNEKTENILSNFFQKEIEFARQVIILPDVPEFGQFVDFLIKGEGKFRLDTMRKNGIEIPAFLAIIQGMEPREAEKVFLDLYNLCIDASGNKSDVLMFFENNGFSMNNISKMLTNAGSRGATALSDLHQLFSTITQGNNYLRTLATLGMNAPRIVNFLDKTGANCCENLKEFYAFWLDEKNLKKGTLKNLETNGINLATLCDIVQKSGASYKKLYYCWFDKEGEKTVRLKNLEKIDVPLGKVCKVLESSGQNASEAFRKLYDLFFERCGKKTRYLKTLEKEKANAAMIFDILTKTGNEVDRIFLHLYNQWFDGTGARTPSLKILLANGRNLPEICRSLSASGNNSVKKFESFLKAVNSGKPPKFSNRTVKKESVKVEFDEISISPQVNVKQKPSIEVRPLQVEFAKSDRKQKVEKVKKSVEKLVKVEKEVLNSCEREVSQCLSKKVEKDLLPKNLAARAVNLNLETVFKRRLTRLVTTKTNPKELNQPTLDRIQMKSFAKIIFDPSSLEHKSLLKFLLENSKTHLGILGIFQKKNITYEQVANVLKGCESPSEVVEVLNELHSFWFNTNGEINSCLKILQANNLNITEVITIFYGSGKKAVGAFQNLHRLWFDAAGDKTRYLTSFEENEIGIKDLITVFKESGGFAAETIQEFYDFFFDPIGGKSKYLRTLEAEGVNLRSIFAILENTGTKASAIFQQLFRLWFDSNKKSEHLTKLEETGLSLNKIVKFLPQPGLTAVETFESLQKFIFARENRQCLLNLQKELPLSDVFEILSDFNVQNFKNLYQVWFDAKGRKTPSLQLLEKNGVNLQCLSIILKGSGLHSYWFFKKLTNHLFDEKGRKTQRMKNIESVIELRSMLKMIAGASGRIDEAFESLYKLWFDEKGKKSNCLLILEKKNIHLDEVSCLLSGSGICAVDKFKKLCLIVGHNNLPKDQLIENFKKYYIDKRF